MQYEPIVNQAIIATNNTLLIKTNARGIIEYVNDLFLEISEYQIQEIIGQDISIFRHPDMPKTISNHLWANVFKQIDSKTILKYISKNGNYFWLQLSVTYKFNANNDIENFYLKYQKVDESKITKIEKIYKSVKDIETYADSKVAEDYFNGLLEVNTLNFNEFMEQYFV